MSSYVCEDIVANIFERLPHKSVIRFRSLSKSCCSRLASPDFVRMHTLRSLNNNTSHQKVLMKHSFFILFEGISWEHIFTLHTRDQLPLDIKRGYKGITAVELPSDINGTNIVGSCNGILCLKSFNRLISLWNYSVRRKVAVPAHPSIGASKEVPNVVFGFGYDRIAHDYHIVGISYSRYKGITRNDFSFIYSMKTDSWTIISPPTSLFSKVRSNACFLDGNLHWVVFGATDSYFIMTFSLTTRVFGTIQLPKNWRHKGGCRLTIINGSLAVICRTWDDTIIWLMREYDNVESWFMFFQLQTKYYDHINVLQPITNDNLVIYDKMWGRFYEDEIKSFTEIQKFRPDFGMVEMETYVESLELLDRGIPCGTTVFPWTKTCKCKRTFTSLNNDVDRDNDDHVNLLKGGGFKPRGLVGQKGRKPWLPKKRDDDDECLIVNIMVLMMIMMIIVLAAVADNDG